MTLLQNREHGADAFDPGSNKDDCFVAPASLVITADHNPRRDDGGPLGWRFCQSGSEVVGDYPEPTRHTLIRHNTNCVGEGASDVVQLAG
jgi:hypothetical protein